LGAKNQDDQKHYGLLIGIPIKKGS